VVETPRSWKLEGHLDFVGSLEIDCGFCSMRVRPCGREERGANFLRLKELERMGLAI